MLVIVSIAGLWEHFNSADLAVIVLSGFVGIAIGDSFLFSAMQRLGPRRTQILYACNAPISVILGIAVLGESLSLKGVLGVVMVFAGVVAAIRWGRPKVSQAKIHRWEVTEGKLLIGVGLGLAAALGQSLGAIIIKPVLDEGANPLLVSTLRIGVSALFLTAIVYIRNIEPPQTITIKQRFLSTFNGVLAIGVGMSLLLYAFSIGDIGVASILSSTQAVMMLPVIWLKTRQRPALGAWIGAVLVVSGVGFMFGR